MAEARLTVGVGVELEPGPVTREWLIGLGWVPPVSDSDASVLTELDDVEEVDDYDPRPDELISMTDPVRGKALTGAEAMRCEARKLRHDLMRELSSPERVDELLRLCDVNVSRLQDASECGC